MSTKLIPPEPHYILPKWSDTDSSKKITESKNFWRVILLVVVILWATNFPVIKAIYKAVPSIDASVYSSMRFGLAGLLFVPYSIRKIHKTDMVLQSMLIGVALSFAYLGQGVGLRTSTADKAAFVCMLQVVWVAIVTAFRERKCSLHVWFTVILALIGSACIELYGSSEIVVGDVWLALQPFGFGTGYILLEQVVRKYPDDAFEVTGFKLIAVGICMSLWALYEGHELKDYYPILESREATLIILYTTCITTGLCIFLQSIAFKRVSAQDASIIVTTEPIWAGCVSYLLLGETLDHNDIFGGILIGIATLSYEIKFIEKLTSRQK